MTASIHWQPYPWQQPMWQQWLQRLSSGRVPHALLLTGAQGTGKVALAGLIAAQQLCERNEALPCQHCKSCELMAVGNHPHVYDLGAGLDEHKLSVTQIREATAFLMSTPVMHGPKIVILPEAHALGQAAANALLKTLEEPLGHTLLILTTALPGRVIPTIRSRCQPLNLQVAETPAFMSWLQHHFQLTETEVKRRWFWVEGSPLRVDPAIVSEAIFADFLVMGRALQQSTPQALWTLRRLTEKHDLNMLISWWQRWLILLMGPAISPLIWPDLTAILMQGLPLRAKQHVFVMADTLQQLMHELAAGFSMNAPLQFEALLYQWLKGVHSYEHTT